MNSSAIWRSRARSISDLAEVVRQAHEELEQADADVFHLPNLRKQSAREILPSVCEQLRGGKCALILPNQMRGTMHALHDEVMALDYMDTAEAVRIADAAVVLGGDGTMLRIARAAAQNELPLLGINVGHVGFMTELEPAELIKCRRCSRGLSARQPHDAACRGRAPWPQGL